MADAILSGVAVEIIKKLGSGVLQDTRLGGVSKRSLGNSGGQFQRSKLCFLMQSRSIRRVIKSKNGDLGISGCVSLTHMPRGIGQLTSLEYLTTFVLAKDNGVSKHSGGLSELRYLNNLRRHLEISNLQSCPNLTSMPLIPSVQRLVLINASKKSLEDILKMKISVSQSTSSSISLSPLKILYIEGIEDLEVLPEDLWHLTSLEVLSSRLVRSSIYLMMCSGNPLEASSGFNLQI
ncbi:hypothetical protein GH714_016040 [Hevea brasiliensis]|uniref:NB-ARC domain-containing protein n=1 Tax=Hevea brasiliensis TaxID=3981 RepID=A0A6A6N5L3_HEVBR|nr:hypothetical protein GH714_016040 [Hevea brasiliensis]